MYKWRHLIENFFCDLKAFRSIATRYEKTDQLLCSVHQYRRSIPVEQMIVNRP